MARKLNFVLPTDEMQMADNWTKLRNSIEQREFDPFFGTTPLAEGFANVTSYWAYYFTMGPLVFFSITMYTDGDSITWPVSAPLLLPIQASSRGSTQLLEGYKCFPATSPGHAGTVSDWFQLQSTSLLADGGHAVHGGSESVNVSGWYFRE